jgi:hypothetical protein
LSSIALSSPKFHKKYQYRTKTGHCNGRKRLARNGIFDLSTFLNVCNMNQEKMSSASYNNSIPQMMKAHLPILKLFNKANHVKDCKYRNESGFCTRSQHRCPATSFIITFNN